MLRIKTYNKTVTTQGYHEDERGKKFIKVVVSLDHVCVKVKLQKGKDLHLISNTKVFKYIFAGSFVQFYIDWKDVHENLYAEINSQLHNVWFE